MKNPVVTLVGMALAAAILCGAVSEYRHAHTGYTVVLGTTGYKNRFTNLVAAKEFANQLREERQCNYTDVVIQDDDGNTVSVFDIKNPTDAAAVKSTAKDISADPRAHGVDVPDAPLVTWKSDAQVARFLRASGVAVPNDPVDAEEQADRVAANNIAILRAHGVTPSSDPDINAAGAAGFAGTNRASAN